MGSILVSVVVPIYNVEKYLCQCIDSIIRQTYANIEIILVDDGSPDRCPAICDEYLHKDSRIKVIHKANGGLSDARNAGTKIAQGNYITYIDSDDWVEKRYVEVLLNLIKQYNAEMSICAAKNVKQREERITKENSKTISLTKKEALEKMLYQDGMDTGAWGRLIKTDIAKRNPFPKGKLFEDLATTYKYMFGCETIVYTNEKLYYYFQNQSSITRSKANEQRLDILPIINTLVTDVVRVYPDLEPAAMSRKFSVYCYVLKQLQKLDRLNTAEGESTWAFICSYRGRMLLDKNARVKNRCAALLSYMGQGIFSTL